MRIKFRLTLLLSVFLVFALKSSGKEPIKFGKIGIEEFKDLVYAPDTSATAVVLCQYGYFDSRQFQFTLTRRVKILKKEGMEYAEYAFRGGTDVLVKGKTYNLENGKIVEDKLKSESIFQERIIDQVYQQRVAMPNVKIGSIIDIETTQYGLPWEFRFQEKIPVKYCELDLEENPEIEFRKRKVGFIPISKVDGYKYIAENVPAFKAEPYITSEENYISKFEFDVLRISTKTFTVTWQNVDKYLRDSPSFGKVFLFSSNYLSDLSDEIEAKYTSQLDRAKAAYEAIKIVSWNKTQTLYAGETSLNSVYKKKVANSAEINMMLYQLLSRLKITACPVVLCTRPSGFLYEYSPSIEKLNYTIVSATIDGKEYLLDATEKYLPFGMLPERCLNVKGRTYDQTADGRWVSLDPAQKENQLTGYDLILGNDLILKGKIQKSKDEYSAFNFRCKFKEFASEESYINDLETKNPGLTIKDYKLSNIDSIYAPTNEEYNVEITNKAERVNDLIMVYPFIFERQTENPFKIEDRKYPVDFPYLKNENMVVKITIPEGFVISEAPKPVSIIMPANTAIAKINYTTAGNVLLVTYRLQINKLTFTKDEYPMLRELYSQIIKAQAQPIVLKPGSNASNN
jgi:hypothetical protein